MNSRLVGDFARYLREERHLSDSTAATRLGHLERLRRRVNLWDSDAPRRFIAGSSWGVNYKGLTEYAYLDFCRFQGFDYALTKHRKEPKTPPKGKPTESAMLGGVRLNKGLLSFPSLPPKD